MYDVDPPSPILRLDAPRAATQPTLKTDAQHLARRTALQPATEPHTLISRMDGSVLRLRALSKADADLSGALDAEL